MKVVDAHIPDSATTAFSSLAMYCTGVPRGGVAQSCIRDLTTSSEKRVRGFDGKEICKLTYPEGRRRANMRSVAVLNVTQREGIERSQTYTPGGSAS
jgi:hypothetical protein